MVDIPRIKFLTEHGHPANEPFMDGHEANIRRVVASRVDLNRLCFAHRRAFDSYHLHSGTKFYILQACYGTGVPYSQGKCLTKANDEHE
jgi:hypothetical protein